MGNRSNDKLEMMPAIFKTNRMIGIKWLPSKYLKVVQPLVDIGNNSEPKSPTVNNHVGWCQLGSPGLHVWSSSTDGGRQHVSPLQQ